MLYVVKLNALNDSPSLMGIEEHIPDVWNVCRECRCCWYQCSNVIFKVGRESVTRVPFFFTVWHFSECSLWWYGSTGVFEISGNWTLSNVSKSLINPSAIHNHPSNHLSRPMLTFAPWVNNVNKGNQKTLPDQRWSTCCWGKTMNYLGDFGQILHFTKIYWILQWRGQIRKTLTFKNPICHFVTVPC